MKQYASGTMRGSPEADAWPTPRPNLPSSAGEVRKRLEVRLQVAGMLVPKEAVLGRQSVVLTER